MTESDRVQPEAEGDPRQDAANEIVEPGQQAENQAMAEFREYLEKESALDLPARGELYEGVIVEKRANEILVNVGSKHDGVVPQADLAQLDPDVLNTLQEGETVEVVVSRQADDSGIFILSIAQAQQQRDWLRAEALLESGGITECTVDGSNKGGLTAIFSHLRGFIPASHVVDMPRNMNDDQRQDTLRRHIGEKMNVKIIEVEPKRRRLVMSQLLAERERRAARREELIETLHVGDEREGVVRSIRPFGAFIDVGGAEGLLHVSELDWGTVRHPKDVISVGDTLRVQVIRLDPDRGRIGLSRKRVLPNPWETMTTRYREGDIAPVRITRVVDFGAFAELEQGIEGLIHISELADITIAEPLKMVRPGDEIMAKILRIDTARQRVGLSRRQAIESDILWEEDDGTGDDGEEEASFFMREKEPFDAEFMTDEETSQE
ncbi:MAG: S1 RNA-binding domain-containing protein [Caldilineaceae bacterium]|nr:S1 RNA-binding domain-containing protein [Caldilineaceae bacterium]